jgi:protein-tyrosine phosphatase
MQKILFVCLGNICRSPTAEGVMRSLVAAQGRQDEFFLDSAGTGDWHVGQAPDRRAQAACRRAGIDISSHRARRGRPEDFQKFDLILACDRENLRDLRAMMPEGSGARLAMLRDYSTETPGADVPDPYYGGDAGFDETVQICLQACEQLLRQCQEKNGD